jgi:hypothetical protein
MSARLTIDVLAERVCRVIRDVRSEHQAWVEIDHIRDRIAAEELHTVDAAVAFASAKGWLSIGGVPAHSVLLNRAAP